jgi:Tfp pilus assembly protein PilF
MWREEMYRNPKTMPAAILLLVLFLTLGTSVRAQNSVSSGQTRAALTILDSNKEQDGLAGPVRRVTIQTAKLEVKQGRVVEGPLQVLEITTYGITGNRIDNISYPVADSLVGKEEYKYDDKGHIIEMTLRDDRGSILNREAYDYEFDRFGNWTKMVTSLLVFEAGEVKHEAVEVTYRKLTYYFDDSIAKIVDASLPLAKPVPAPVFPIKSVEKDTSKLTNHSVSGSLLLSGDNPPEISKPETTNTASPLAAEADSEKETAGMQTNAFAALTTPANAGAPEAEKTSAPARNEPDGTATGSNREAKPIAPVVGAANSPAPSGSSAEIREDTPASDNIKQKSALEYHKTGLALFEAGGLKAAVKAYLISLALDPNSAEVHLSLAHAYLKLQKDNDAVKAFKESIRLNPDEPEAHYGLGLVYFRLHRNKDASGAFKRATILKPDMGKAHYGLALAYQELGRQDALMEEYRILERLDRSLAKQLSQTFPASNPPCSAGPFCN